jgi:hypothetical protein
MYGLTRGTLTLIGAAAAGVLLWIASQVDAEGLGGFWLFMALLAGAGLCIPISQLLGGWTKWGWPRASLNVLLLGFVPALVAGGLVILHAQPESAWGRGFAGDIGLGNLAEDMAAVLPAIAFALGALFGLVFDTTGPAVARDQDVATARERRGYPEPVASRRSADEPVTAERREVEEERPAKTTRERELVGASSDGSSEQPSRARRLFRRG